MAKLRNEPSESSRTQQSIDALWEFADPAASDRRFRNAIAHANAMTAKLELETQLARAQGLQRKFDAAHQTLNNVEEALQGQKPDSAFAAARVRLLLERGRVFNSSGQGDQALPLFDQAWNFAREIDNDHLAIDAAHMIAIVHGAQHRSDAAMEWNRRALQLAESSNQPRARQWRASLHNNMGWTFHESGRFDEALQHFERALAARLEQNEPADIRIARWCMARCLRSLGRVNEAMQLQLNLLEECSASGGDCDGFVHEELGEGLLALGRAGEAAPHFARAHALLSQDEWFASEHRDRLDRIRSLSRQSTNLGI